MVPGSRTRLSAALVKWQGLNYAAATWEDPAIFVSDLDKSALDKFYTVNKRKLVAKQLPSGQRGIKTRPNDVEASFMSQKMGTDADGLKLVYKAANKKLFDYQIDGIRWFLFNWSQNRGSILADEMGLGKTVQTVVSVEHIHSVMGGGPFLVVAPLSTIGHWQREFAAWTPHLETLVYYGSEDDRTVIGDYGLQWVDTKTGKSVRQNRADRASSSCHFKWDIMITTYETILRQPKLFHGIHWHLILVDEGHRLKSVNSSVKKQLMLIPSDHNVLLTGTPIQNNMDELWSILNFVDRNGFDSLESFQSEFGSIESAEDSTRFQEVLQPYILRRYKSDVLKQIPPKQETIVSVEFTSRQKKLYRGIYERNVTYLAATAVEPQLVNVQMELRKCCNHPYLIKGVEDQLRREDGCADDDAAMELLLKCSGKLVFLDKLLTKLRKDGQKVLIFSQMTRCLDVIHDYCTWRQHPVERLDGGVASRARQEAIDRFNTDSNAFVFLLSTKAGGVGITLTAANNVVIYDGDWNPQNDLQALARCHRIGQTQEVQCYRLITRGSYEQHMFDVASKKIGLEQVVMTSVTQNSSLKLSKKDIDTLLKQGAYSAFSDDAASEERSKKFCEADIDEILESNSKKVQYDMISCGTRSAFSTATFQVNESKDDVDVDDPDFWKKIINDDDVYNDLMARKHEWLDRKDRRGKFSGSYQMPSWKEFLKQAQQDVSNESKLGIGDMDMGWFAAGKRRRALLNVFRTVAPGNWDQMKSALAEQVDEYDENEFQALITEELMQRLYKSWLAVHCRVIFLSVASLKKRRTDATDFETAQLAIWGDSCPEVACDSCDWIDELDVCHEVFQCSRSNLRDAIWGFAVHPVIVKACKSTVYSLYQYRCLIHTNSEDFCSTAKASEKELSNVETHYVISGGVCKRLKEHWSLDEQHKAPNEDVAASQHPPWLVRTLPKRSVDGPRSYWSVGDDIALLKLVWSRGIAELGSAILEEDYFEQRFADLRKKITDGLSESEKTDAESSVWNLTPNQAQVFLMGRLRMIAHGFQGKATSTGEDWWGVPKRRRAFCTGFRALGFGCPHLLREHIENSAIESVVDTPLYDELTDDTLQKLCVEFVCALYRVIKIAEGEKQGIRSDGTSSEDAFSFHVCYGSIPSSEIDELLLVKQCSEWADRNATGDIAALWRLPIGHVVRRALSNVCRGLQAYVDDPEQSFELISASRSARKDILSLDHTTVLQQVIREALVSDGSFSVNHENHLQVEIDKQSPRWIEDARPVKKKHTIGPNNWWSSNDDLQLLRIVFNSRSQDCTHAVEDDVYFKNRIDSLDKQFNTKKRKKRGVDDPVWPADHVESFLHGRLKLLVLSHQGKLDACRKNWWTNVRHRKLFVSALKLFGYGNWQSVRDYVESHSFDLAGNDEVSGDLSDSMLETMAAEYIVTIYRVIKIIGGAVDSGEVSNNAQDESFQAVEADESQDLDTDTDPESERDADLQASRDPFQWHSDYDAFVRQPDVDDVFVVQQIESFFSRGSIVSEVHPLWRDSASGMRRLLAPLVNAVEQFVEVGISPGVSAALRRARKDLECINLLSLANGPIQESLAAVRQSASSTGPSKRSEWPEWLTKCQLINKPDISSGPQHWWNEFDDFHLLDVVSEQGLEGIGNELFEHNYFSSRIDKLKKKVKASKLRLNPSCVWDLSPRESQNFILNRLKFLAKVFEGKVDTSNWWCNSKHTKEFIAAVRTSGGFGRWQFLREAMTDSIEYEIDQPSGGELADETLTRMFCEVVVVMFRIMKICSLASVDDETQDSPTKQEQASPLKSPSAATSNLGHSDSDSLAWKDEYSNFEFQPAIDDSFLMENVQSFFRAQSKEYTDLWQCDISECVRSMLATWIDKLDTFLIDRAACSAVAINLQKQVRKDFEMLDHHSIISGPVQDSLATKEIPGWANKCIRKNALYTGTKRWWSFDDDLALLRIFFDSGTSDVMAMFQDKYFTKRIAGAKRNADDRDDPCEIWNMSTSQLLSFWQFRLKHISLAFQGKSSVSESDLLGWWSVARRRKSLHQALHDFTYGCWAQIRNNILRSDADCQDDDEEQSDEGELQLDDDSLESLFRSFVAFHLCVLAMCAKIFSGQRVDTKSQEACPPLAGHSHIRTLSDEDELNAWQQEILTLDLPVSMSWVKDLDIVRFLVSGDAAGKQIVQFACSTKILPVIRKLGVSSIRAIRNGIGGRCEEMRAAVKSSEKALQSLESTHVYFTSLRQSVEASEMLSNDNAMCEVHIGEDIVWVGSNPEQEVQVLDAGDKIKILLPDSVELDVERSSLRKITSLPAWAWKAQTKLLPSEIGVRRWWKAVDDIELFKYVWEVGISHASTHLPESSYFRTRLSVVTAGLQNLVRARTMNNDDVNRCLEIPRSFLAGRMHAMHAAFKPPVDPSVSLPSSFASKVIQALLSYGLPPKGMAQFVRAAHCQQRFLVAPTFGNNSTDSCDDAKPGARNENTPDEKRQWHWKAPANSILLVQTAAEWGNAILTLLEEDLQKLPTVPRPAVVYDIATTFLTELVKTMPGANVKSLTKNTNPVILNLVKYCDEFGSLGDPEKVESMFQSLQAIHFFKVQVLCPSSSMNPFLLKAEKVEDEDVIQEDRGDHDGHESIGEVQAVKSLCDVVNDRIDIVMESLEYSLLPPYINGKLLEWWQPGVHDKAVVLGYLSLGTESWQSIVSDLSFPFADYLTDEYKSDIASVLSTRFLQIAFLMVAWLSQRKNEFLKQLNAKRLQLSEMRWDKTRVDAACDIIARMGLPVSDFSGTRCHTCIRKFQIWHSLII